MTKSGTFRPRASRSPRNARQAARLSPPIFLIASRIFCPSRRTPIAASTEIAVAFRSIRALTTEPSRASHGAPLVQAQWRARTMSSSARLRARHASQSVLILRQARLTTSLLTAPSNRPMSARFTRRVLVPAR